jgi:serpin B
MPVMKKMLIVFLIIIGSLTIDAQTIVEGNTQFAFDLLAQLKDQKNNVFFSPYSISTALFMTASGARGNTEKQMLKVLHQPQNSLAYHKSFGALITKAGAKKNVELSIVNSIWPQKGYHFKPEYLSLLKTAYKSQVTECDFVKDPNGEALKINKWVADKTKNKITDIIEPGVLDASTRLVLANAIYFYGEWKTTFDSSKTIEAPFYRKAEEIPNVRFMNALFAMEYAHNDMFKMISIPYKNNEVSMLIFLPNEPDSFSTALNSLDIRQYSALSKQLVPQKIDLFLPKFKIETEYMLQDLLPDMGMVDAFSGEANFSGMTSDKSLLISKVIHSAFIDVNEKGTEAAAATVVVVSRNGGNHTITIKLDHPFIFMIKDNATEQLLFMGIMNNPKDE